jgi:hypothetical protein
MHVSLATADAVELAEILSFWLLSDPNRFDTSLY